MDLRGCETVALHLQPEFPADHASLLSRVFRNQVFAGVFGPPFLELAAYLGATFVQSAKCIHDGVERHRARSTKWFSQRRYGFDGASIRCP